MRLPNNEDGFRNQIMRPLWVIEANSVLYILYTLFAPMYNEPSKLLRIVFGLPCIVCIIMGTLGAMGYMSRVVPLLPLCLIKLTQLLFNIFISSDKDLLIPWFVVSCIFSLIMCILYMIDRSKFVYIEEDYSDDI